MNSEDNNNNQRKSTSITNTTIDSSNSKKSKTTTSTSSKTGITVPSTTQLLTNLTVNRQHDLKKMLNNNPFVPYCYRTLPDTYNFKCPLINIVNVLEYISDYVAANQLKPYLPEMFLLAHMIQICIN